MNKEKDYWFCVVCVKHISDDKLLADLGHFNDCICTECEDAKEAKEIREELGLE